MDTKATILCLEKLGVQIAKETDWVGEVGVDRKKITLEDQIASLNPGFTAQEWFDIGTSEGSQYVGDCCSNSAAAQNAVSNALLASGWMTESMLLTIGYYQKNHEGFEIFQLTEDETRDKLSKMTAEEFKSLDVWDRLGLIYTSLQNSLKPDYTMRATQKFEAGDKESFGILLNSLHQLTWEALYNDSNPQIDCNTNFAKTKVLPIVKHLYQHLEACEMSHSGYLIVDQNDKVMTNMRGLAMFETFEQAEELKRIWDKDQKVEPSFIKEFQIINGNLEF